MSTLLMGHAATTPTAADPGIRAGELFEAHGRMVYALCRLILRDSVEAEDAAQQTFLSAYRSLLNGRGPDQPEAWLATIARNECTNRMSRKQPVTVELLESDGVHAPDPARLMDSRAELEALCAAVAELPTKQREAIVLREFYGLSYREVAAALGTTGTAVESAIFKSRKSLQERLRPMRDAAGSLALPLSLQDALSQAIPGFSQAAAGGGVSALVAGLSVVAVGGTLATQQPTRRGRPLAASSPLHALATQPAEAAPPRVHVAVVRAAPVTRTAFVAAKHVPPATTATQDKEDHSSPEVQSTDERQVDEAQPVEHDASPNSGPGRSPTVAAERDSGDSGDSNNSSDDAND